MDGQSERARANSKMSYIVLARALNSTHSVTHWVGQNKYRDSRPVKGHQPQYRALDAAQLC